MAARPAFVEDAFHSVEVIGINEEDINVFSERWGGLGLDAFARALRSGDQRDQQVAAFALGATRSRWARDLLLPLLSHTQSEVRWAVALMLGEMRVEVSFPMLIEMLQEFLPPRPLKDVTWFANTLPYVASILGAWGKEEAISALRHTLAKLWQAEQQHTEEDFQIWWDVQDALAYALGQLGAFDALTGLDISPSRAKLWHVTLVMGYLNARQSYKSMLVDFFLDTSKSQERVAFLALVSDLLQEKMGWSSQEAATFSDAYQREYFGRWEQQ